MVTRRRAALAAVAAVVVVAAVYSWLHGSAPAAGAAPPPPLPRPPSLEPLPRIALGRLQARGPSPPLGQRDVFDYGARPVTQAPAPPPPSSPSLPPTRPRVLETSPLGPPLPPVATPIPLAPINVKYIGTLEGKTGLKVAVFLTDDREVLTGQAGEVIANRYRILKIGLESADLVDLSSGQTRRIPLRGGS